MSTLLFQPEVIALLVAGALGGGIITGIAGFGSGPVVMGLWLLVIEPRIAAPLLMTCAGVHLLVSLRLIWHAVRWRRLVPFVLGSFLGVPFGTMILKSVAASTLKLGIGILLLAFAIVRLTVLNRFKGQAANSGADFAVGILGGVVSGSAGVPGPIWSLWCNLKGWGKDEQRAVYQPLNVAAVYLTLAAYAYAGLLTSSVFYLAAWCLPAFLVGIACGMPLYRRLDDRSFSRVVLTLLAVMGVALIVEGLR